MALSLFQNASVTTMLASRKTIPMVFGSPALSWMGSRTLSTITTTSNLIPTFSYSSKLITRYNLNANNNFNNNTLSPLTAQTTLGMFVRCFSKDDSKLSAAQKASQKKTAQKKAQVREAKKKAKAKQAAQAQPKKRVYKGPTSVHDLPPPKPLRREKAKPVVVHEEVPARTPRDPIVGLAPKYRKISKWINEGGPEKAKDSLLLNEVFPDAFQPFQVVLPIIAKYHNFFVYLGNPLKASATKEKPVVNWPAPSSEDIFTLALVDPDSPGRDDPHKRPFLHWLVVNIPGDKVDEGQTVTEYIPALPFKGTGEHRLVFLLFSQKKGVVDVSKTGLPHISASNLEDRETFPLHVLIKKFNLAAKSASFFKTQWDESVGEFYASQGQSEPIYVTEKPVKDDRFVIPGRQWL